MTSQLERTLKFVGEIFVYPWAVSGQIVRRLADKNIQNSVAIAVYNVGSEI